MSNSEPPDQSIEDLIGRGPAASNPIDEVRRNLGGEEWEALLEGTMSPVNAVGPVLLFLTPDEEEAAELVEWLRDRATVLPINQLQKPRKTSMEDFCAVVISDTFLPMTERLTEFSEGIPVAILQDDVNPGSAGDHWQLPRPLTQLKNSDVIDQLLLGEHPPATAETFPMAPLPVVASTQRHHQTDSVSGPDPVSAIRVLLEARHSGQSTIEALRQWVTEDPAFLGWVELKMGAEGVEVKAGGKEPGAVLRSIGDEIDVGQPIPTTSGSLGPFVGMPLSDSWIGFLARNAQHGRREFWKTFALIPLIEPLIPSVSRDGIQLVEGPEERFCRLLQARIEATQRRGGSIGVVLLESPGASQQRATRITALLRGGDWIEAAGERLWILLDQPEQGAAESLSRRLAEAVPGIRGAGTMTLSTDIQARDYMDRVIQILQSNDELYIEDHRS